MEKVKETADVDLFGNSTLTPRQLMQQQLAKLLEDTAARTAGLDTRMQGVSRMGAAAGALIGQGLIKAGVVEEPEDMKRARKFGEVREQIKADVADAGVDPVNSPKEYADRAATHFLRAGMEPEALKAIQWGQLQESMRRVADAERAKIANIEADTKLKEVKAANGDGDGHGRGEYTVETVLADGSIAFADRRRGRVIDPVDGKVITDPKRLRGAKYDPALKRELSEAEAFGKQTGGAKFDLPTAEATARRALKSIDDALADPALKQATGAFMGRLPALFGDQARGVARINQLKGGAFLTAYESLRGGGHITEVEGQKGEDAIARLNRAQTYEDFSAALRDLRGVVLGGLDVARRKAQRPGDKRDVKDAEGVPEAPQKRDVESLLKKYGGK